MHQALTTIRSSARASFAVSRSSSRKRLVHSSMPSRATALRALPTSEPEEITLAPIFDIFDVPSRLGQNPEFLSLSKHAQRQPRSINQTSSLERPPPSALPTPVLFDGPARPRNLPLAFQHRIEQALNPASPSTRQTRQHHTPASFPMASEPLVVETFDGPARLSRRSYGPSKQGRMGNQILFFALASAVGGLTLLSHDSLPMMSQNEKLKR